MSDIDVVFLGPKLVNHFQSHAPNIQLKMVPIEPENYVERLDRGEIHIAINVVGENSCPSGFRRRRFFRMNLSSYRREHHPRIKNTLTLKGFFRLSHVKVEKYDQETIEPIFAQKGVTRKVAFIVNHHSGSPICGEAN